MPTMIWRSKYFKASWYIRVTCNITNNMIKYPSKNDLNLQQRRYCTSDLDSSVGRASDWRSEGPWFNPGSRHHLLLNYKDHSDCLLCLQSMRQIENKLRETPISELAVMLSQNKSLWYSSYLLQGKSYGVMVSITALWILRSKCQGSENEPNKVNTM